MSGEEDGGRRKGGNRKEKGTKLAPPSKSSYTVGRLNGQKGVTFGGFLLCFAGG